MDCNVQRMNKLSTILPSGTQLSKHLADLVVAVPDSNLLRTNAEFKDSLFMDCKVQRIKALYPWLLNSFEK